MLLVFYFSASFHLLFAFSCLRCFMYIMCELLAAFSKCSIIGTLFTPPHSSTAALRALSPIIVSSLKDVLYIVSIHLFALNDLSTSAFEWQNARAHLTIFGNITKCPLLASFLLNILCQNLWILSFMSSSVTSSSWYIIHSYHAVTSSSSWTLGISLATTL